MTLPTGVRLHWREAGDPASPAVVWIHGGSVEDSSFMLPDLEPFLPRIRALFPDTRGTRSHRAEVQSVIADFFAAIAFASPI